MRDGDDEVDGIPVRWAGPDAPEGVALWLTHLGGSAEQTVPMLTRLGEGEADRYAQWFFDAFNPISHVEAYQRDVAIAFLCGGADAHVPAEAADRFRAALIERDPAAADRVRVERYDGLDHLEAARDE